MSWYDVFQMYFDKSDTDKSDFREVGFFFGNRHVFGGFEHVNSDPIFDQSEFFHRKSELTQTCTAAYALRTAQFRPFSGSIPPTEASAKKSSLRSLSETCLTSDGRRITERKK